MPGRPLSAVLREPVLLRVAGETAFARGRELHQHGHVAELSFTASLAAAMVADGAEYSVTITSEEGELDSACSCPASAGGLLCAHGVAAALAWLEWRKSGQSKKAPRAAAKASLEESLAALPPPVLVKMLLEVASQSPLARQTLERLAALHGARGQDITGLRKGIALQLASTGRGAVRGAADLAQRLLRIRNDLGAVLQSGNLYGALDLWEYAMEHIGRFRITSSFAHQMADIVAQSDAFHAALCRQTAIQPAALAHRLLRLITDSRYQVIVQPAESHGELLGEEGLRALQSILPDAAPLHLFRAVDVALGDATHFHRAIARRRDRAQARDYLALARIHAEQGDVASAAAAAEEGLQHCAWDRRSLEDAMAAWRVAATGGSPPTRSEADPPSPPSPAAKGRSARPRSRSAPPRD